MPADRAVWHTDFSVDEQPCVRRGPFSNLFPKFKSTVPYLRSKQCFQDAGCVSLPTLAPVIKARRQKLCHSLSKDTGAQIVGAKVPG